ncbi:MAG: hypothetical protein Q8N51_10320 [Gammaproteobacteria bacterium]|nr:hypothetical protein [Gammaproteobacteria bacterium]
MLSRLRALVVVVAVAVAACAGPTPSASPSPQPSSIALPTIGELAGCAGASFDAAIHGDPADSRVAWLIVGNQQVDIVWPPGYRARFVPGLEILDPAGRVILREGDPVTGGCSLEHGIYVEPPF